MKPMTPAISLVTLGVSDLTKSVAFYREGLGLPYSQHSNEHVAFFELNGCWLGLFPKTALADDVGISAEGTGFRGVTIAHNAPSEAEVDRIMALAEQAGAKIMKPAQKVFWGGYSGYFADPDGHLWEIAWNPHFTPLS